MHKRGAAILVAVVVAVTLMSGPALAACAAISEEELLAEADLVFEGVALDGPTNHLGQLISPARFQVAEYVKGAGGETVPIETQVRTASGPVGEEDFFAPRPGESWRIYGFDGPEPGTNLGAGLCAGSTRIGALHPPTPTPTAPELAEPPATPGESPREPPPDRAAGQQGTATADASEVSPAVPADARSPEEAVAPATSDQGGKWPTVAGVAVGVAGLSALLTRSRGRTRRRP